MSLNADLIRQRCAEIEESVGRLERVKALPRKKFLANQDTLDIACYRLLIAIEAALALCYHILSHIDRHRRSGETRKELLSLSFAEALTVADEDIQDRWAEYRDRYLRGE